MTEKRLYKNPQINLRIPQELKDQVQEAAEANGRSMNAEIVQRIERTFLPAVSSLAAKAKVDEAHLPGTVTTEEQLLEQINLLRQQMFEQMDKLHQQYDELLKDKK